MCRLLQMIKDTTWFSSDRPLGETSLGGLIILVFVRTIQLNTMKTKVSARIGVN